jgi:hypothetical protein
MLVLNPWNYSAEPPHPPEIEGVSPLRSVIRYNQW